MLSLVALIMFSILVMLPSQADAQAVCEVVDSGAGYVNAATSSSSDVQTAIGNATSTGQTVCIPAGNATWTSMVTNCYDGSTPITASRACTAKWIHLRGAGVMPTHGAATSGGTTITVERGAGVIIWFESNDGPASVSNIKFITTQPFSTSGAGVLVWEDTDAGVTPCHATPPAHVNVVHHITYTDTSTPAQAPTGPNSIFLRVAVGRGLAYRNVYTGTAPNSLEAHLVSCGRMGKSVWEQTRSMGDLDTTGRRKFYFENNILTNIGQTTWDGTSRGVSRFNAYENSGNAGHGKDSSPNSMREFEAYKNTFTCTTGNTANFWISIRGGVQYVFQNTMDNIGAACGSDQGTDVATSAFILRFRCETGCFLESGVAGDYPAPQQFGWGYITGGTTINRQGYTDQSGDDSTETSCVAGSSNTANDADNPYAQDIEGSYFWSNYRSDQTTKIYDGSANNGGIGLILSGADTCDLGQTMSTFIQENREWYKQNDSFNGTTGVGIGAIASRPATCTTGVAYWATDEGGDWDTTGGSANDGKLYKCTATDTWTAYYTPKAYPHYLNTVVQGTASAVSTTTIGAGVTLGPGTSVR